MDIWLSEKNHVQIRDKTITQTVTKLLNVIKETVCKSCL